MSAVMHPERRTRLRRTRSSVDEMVSPVSLCSVCLRLGTLFHCGYSVRPFRSGAATGGPATGILPEELFRNLRHEASLRALCESFILAVRSIFLERAEEEPRNKDLTT
jgi:hypothetical protein